MLFASICCSHLSTESKVSRFGMCQDLQALEKWSDMTWKFQLEVVECFLHRHTRKKAGQTSTSCCESLLWNVVKHCSTPPLIPWSSQVLWHLWFCIFIRLNPTSSNWLSSSSWLTVGVLTGTKSALECKRRLVWAALSAKQSPLWAQRTGFCWMCFTSTSDITSSTLFLAAFFSQVKRATWMAARLWTLNYS